MVLAPAFVGSTAGESTTPERPGLGGSWRPKIDEKTWPGWEPPEDFATQFKTWEDKPAPEAIQIWCKGFIPDNATQEMVRTTSGQLVPTIRMTGPGGLPIPGLLGMCAGIDGRSWSPRYPETQRPGDARFWGWLSYSRTEGVMTATNCGYSYNYCCNPKGCWDDVQYGETTCTKHCADDEMQAERLACWTAQGTNNGSIWSSADESCDGKDAADIVATKVYIKGRGGNPCGEVAGVSDPPASWDAGLVIIPSKRKVTVTGYVDDAPSYECYARAKDNGIWGEAVTLAQVPAELKYNIVIELAGYSDRPLNTAERFFDLPLPDTMAGIVV